MSDIELYKSKLSNIKMSLNYCLQVNVGFLIAYYIYIHIINFYKTV